MISGRPRGECLVQDRSTIDIQGGKKRLCRSKQFKSRLERRPMLVWAVDSKYRLARQIWRTFWATWTRMSGFTRSTLVTLCRLRHLLSKTSWVQQQFKLNFPANLSSKNSVSSPCLTSAWALNSAFCTNLTKLLKGLSFREKTRSTGTGRPSNLPFRFCPLSLR